MILKPGWQTTEFWITLATIVIGAFVTFGIFPQEQGDQILAFIVWLITSGIATTSYNYSRALVKVAVIKTASLASVTELPKEKE